MIPGRRHAFNASYADERYRAFTAEISRRAGAPIEFRLSETPCFMPSGLFTELAAVADDLIRQLLDNPDYRRAADAVVPDRFRVSGSEDLPTFVQVDFGLVQTGGGLEGRLVELQAFPSLYGFQLVLGETSRDVWELDDVHVPAPGLDRAGYLDLLRRAIVGDHDPSEVVLMEIDPTHQKTRPDFEVTERLWGVRAIDVRDVAREGRRLTYQRDGRRVPIRRIYNRVIPDGLERTGLALPFDYRDDLDVEWTGGPDWFFRISKFSIPWLRHPWVPRTQFLDRLDEVPGDRANWLLKPLFSYAGGGILFGPTDADLRAIPPHRRPLYVLQERVPFTPVVETPHGPTQVEIRVMMVRQPDGYRAVLPLLRMGRGRMMGVDHNKGLSWVGASAAMLVD